MEIRQGGRDLRCQLEMTAADLMADPRYTNQGMVIQSMKLASNPPKKKPMVGKKKRKDQRATATAW